MPTIRAALNIICTTPRPLWLGPCPDRIRHIPIEPDLPNQLLSNPAGQGASCINNVSTEVAEPRARTRTLEVKAALARSHHHNIMDIDRIDDRYRHRTKARHATKKWPEEKRTKGAVGMLHYSLLASLINQQIALNDSESS